MPTATTPKKRARACESFLAALEETHLVSEAAKAAGIHRATAYEWRKQDPQFAAAWGDVEDRSTEVLEQIAVRRAAQGSDVLLMFLLKARRPELYREHHHVEHTGPGGDRMKVEFNLDEVSRKVLSDVLRRRPAGS